MITITHRAAKQILSQPPEPGMALRVAAKRLPDGGLDYAFGWDAPGKHDSRGESAGVAIIVAPTSVALLHGATLDYVAMEATHRFIFLNPNDPSYVPPKPGLLEEEA